MPNASSDPYMASPTLHAARAESMGMSPIFVLPVRQQRLTPSAPLLSRAPSLWKGRGAHPCEESYSHACISLTAALCSEQRGGAYGQTFSARSGDVPCECTPANHPRRLRWHGGTHCTPTAIRGIGRTRGSFLKELTHVLALQCAVNFTGSWPPGVWGQPFSAVYVAKHTPSFVRPWHCRALCHADFSDRGPGTCVLSQQFLPALSLSPVSLHESRPFDACFPKHGLSAMRPPKRPCAPCNHTAYGSSRCVAIWQANSHAYYGSVVCAANSLILHPDADACMWPGHSCAPPANTKDADDRPDAVSIACWVPCRSDQCRPFDLAAFLRCHVWGFSCATVPENPGRYEHSSHLYCAGCQQAMASANASHPRQKRGTLLVLS